MKVLSLEDALYFCKFTIRPYNIVVMSGWLLLVAAWICYINYRMVCRTVAPSLATIFEPLVHRRKIASLSLFCRYYCGKCSCEQAELDPLPHSHWRSTCYTNRLHDFSATIPRCYKDVYVNSFFPSTDRLWNSLPAEFFPLIYDLNGFKSISNQLFYILFIFFFFFL